MIKNGKMDDAVYDTKKYTAVKRVPRITIRTRNYKLTLMVHVFYNPGDQKADERSDDVVYAIVKACLAKSSEDEKMDDLSALFGSDGEQI